MLHLLACFSSYKLASCSDGGGGGDVWWGSKLNFVLIMY